MNLHVDLCVVLPFSFNIYIKTHPSGNLHTLKACSFFLAFVSLCSLFRQVQREVRLVALLTHVYTIHISINETSYNTEQACAMQQLNTLPGIV